MVDFFFYGTLCHAPLLRIVLGRDVDTEPAQLADHAVYWAEGHAFPVIVAAPGTVAKGVVVRGLTAQDVARLDYYEGVFACQSRDVAVQTAGATLTARVYIQAPGDWHPGAVWSLTDWVARYGPTVVSTAGDVMDLHGSHPTGAVLRRYPQMLARGASRVRAEQSAIPTNLRRRAVPGDVEQVARRLPYANFFAVEEADLRFRRFDGTMSRVIDRAVFLSSDAVTVLPYDPVRDRVLLIEQFRPGPHARGDAQPWLLEAIAGRIDPGETPQDAARREAVEEAALELGDLISVAGYYPSPAGKAEFLYSYIGLADLPDGVAGVFGVDEEAEDIRGHLIGFDTLMQLIAGGEVAHGSLLVSALWLALERPRLRGASPTNTSLKGSG